MIMGHPSEPSGEDSRGNITSETARTSVWCAWLRFAPWAAIGALALTATWLAFQNLSLRTENSNLLVERRLAEVAYRTAQNQLAERSLLAETMINDLGARLRRSENLARLKVVPLASPTGATPNSRAIAVWDSDQHVGLLTFEELPAITDEQDYRIWITDSAISNPVNAGAFHIAVAGGRALTFKPDQPIRQATAFSITLEKKGGGPKTEGGLILLGKLPDR